MSVMSQSSTNSAIMVWCIAAAHFLHTVCTFARIGGFSAQGLHSLLSFA